MDFHLQALCSEVAKPQSLATLFLGATLLCAARAAYLVYFHPLSKFPGPRLAAVSDLWYGYHWLSGRYPWAIEDALRQYGDVVRIAPNELVFVTPQAIADIYGPHDKGLEAWVKTDFNNMGKGLGGIVWEEDPVRHRAVARQLHPAFSSRNVRALEPLVHRHIDYFVARMAELGGAAAGVDVAQWTNWLAMDLAGAMSLSEDLGQQRAMRNDARLDMLLAFNAFATAMQVFKRFGPVLRQLQYLLVPASKLLLFARTEATTRRQVRRRIADRQTQDHADFFEFLLPAAAPAPADTTHLAAVAVQLTFAEFGPMSDWFYSALVHVLAEPACHAALVREVRAAFARSADIVATAVAPLPYLHACLKESLRLFNSNSTGLPRISPGAVVDGHFVPKGAHVQTSVFASFRSARYFHEPLRFRPQRWLAPGHALHEPRFAADDASGFVPFSLGPRMCMGRELAWMQGKLFLAKVLWAFDVALVSGQRVDGLDAALRHYGFLVKPEVRVRFTPVER
ncbi:cytochrome P450 [Lasiosphaeria ovina]|uniref:Cytochrome P450 n=1 Tax=Lasiosphaeria ovina TaxID=92902 RepID=A0AAE0NAZ5_9PEZI|nr:cytochrome P450 [Lasiosphaeria ovina]